MIQFLWVFIGGGLGSCARFGMAKIIVQDPNSFPWATFAANVISCIVLGFLLGMQIRNGLSEQSRILLITGFCGGFSTFSTFSAETLSLLQNGQINLAFLYILASVLICLLCIYLGIKINVIL